MVKKILRLFFIGLIICLYYTCSDENDNVGPTTTFKTIVPPKGSKAVYWVKKNQETPKLVEGKIMEIEDSGKKLTKVQIRELNTNLPNGVDIYGNEDSSKKTVTLNKIDIFDSPENSASKTIKVIFSEPVKFDVEPSDGVEQVVNAKGRLDIGGTVINFDDKIHYKLVNSKERIELPLYVVEDCKHYYGYTMIYGKKTEVDIWYKPGLGLVDFRARSELLDAYYEGKMDSYTNVIYIDDSTILIKSENILGLDGGPQIFELNTFSVNNKLDADKNTHAKIWVEVREVDSDKAKSGFYPSVWHEVGVHDGVFSETYSQLNRSSVSLFHPEEKGENFIYWNLLVDKGAKNSEGDSTFYYAKVGLSTTNAKVRVSGAILYKIYKGK